MLRLMRIRNMALIREIESSVDHNHCTTRQFQHKTFCHEGVWFVFYSDGKDFWYQTSQDGGQTWRRAAEPVAQDQTSTLPILTAAIGGLLGGTGIGWFMARRHTPIRRSFRRTGAGKAAYCRQCGGRLKPGDVHCRQCGAKIR